MGQKTDPASKAVLCSSLTEKKAQNTRPEAGAPGASGIISHTTGRFYIVVASFQSESDAQREADRIGKGENQKVTIIKNNQGQYRVCVNDYPNLDEAKQGKEKYGKTYSGAWILNY
jgi:septal ring-binding cell division protein DamX